MLEKTISELLGSGSLCVSPDMVESSRFCVDTSLAEARGLPIGGHRFEGLLPPVVSGPAFTIRRRASRLIPLEEYVKTKIMTEAQVRVRAGPRLRMLLSLKWLLLLPTIAW